MQGPGARAVRNNTIWIPGGFRDLNYRDHDKNTTYTENLADAAETAPGETAASSAALAAAAQTPAETAAASAALAAD